MNKAIFIIKDSVKAVRREWKMNLIFTEVLFGSMLLMVYCLSSIRFLQNDTEQMKYKDIERTIEVSFTQDELLDGQSIHTIMEKCQAEKGTISAIKKMNIPTLDNSVRFVLGVDDMYWTYHVIEVSKGNLSGFSNGSKDCLIGKQCAKENGLSIGDSIEIKGIHFKIADITNQRRYQNYIIILYDWFSELNIQEEIQQTILITEKDINFDKTNRILAEEIGGDILYCENAGILYRQTADTVQRWIRLRVIAGIIGVIFSTFNILAVCFGKIQDRKKEYLIKKVLGLSEAGILLEFFTENVMVAFLAGVLAVGAFVPLAQVLGIDSVVMIDGKIMAGLFGEIMIFAWVYAVILVLYLRKNASIEMMQEGE